MPRTPLMQALLRIAEDHRSSTTSGIPVGESPPRRGEEAKGITRRQVLLGAFAASSVPTFARLARAQAGGPRVAIVGGGLSGLAAAVALADKGVSCTIYEAMERVGGRTRTERAEFPGCGSCHSLHSSTDSVWAEGQTTDIFGELIDSGHGTMRALADRYSLPLVDAIASEPPGSTETYYFFGSHYPKAEADAEFAAIERALRDDLHAAGYPTLYNVSKPGGRSLDQMSVYDWIESRIPGGHGSRLGSLLDVAYNIEFGADTHLQSALNLIYLLGYQPGGPTQLNMYGVSDERYRMQGGIEQLSTAMAQDVCARGASIQTGWRLEAIEARSDGTARLSFDRGFATSVDADYVILALPFAVLRDLDLSRAGFDGLKMKAIRELGAGHNGKLHLQFNDRFWNQPGPWGLSGGTSYSDTGYQVAWEATRGQPGLSGILAFYTGGGVTDSLSQRHPYASATVPTFRSGLLADASRFLEGLGPVFPIPGGVASKWNGRAEGSVAHLNPYFNCSYSYWKVGQYQTIAGYERVPQGCVLFAGEHTSVDFQGWMEGAVAEGVRAGKEVLALMRRK